MRELVIPIFALSAASLALWLDFRFPKLAPTALRGALMHAIFAYGLFLASRTLFELVASRAAYPSLTGIFAVQLPILIYTFLACVWLLKVLRGALAAAR